MEGNFNLSGSTVGSISIAHKFSMPLIATGWLPIFWSKQSLKLWAGSVEMIMTYFSY